MTTTLLDIVAVGGAGMAAGTINAMAGGGTLIAFPCLVALGVPTVSANVTVTVGQTPGYLAGAWTQRADLGSGLRAARRLAVFAGVGAVIGALLLQVTPNNVFRDVVPFLILAGSGTGSRRARPSLSNPPRRPTPRCLRLEGAAHGRCPSSSPWVASTAASSVPGWAS